MYDRTEIYIFYLGLVKVKCKVNMMVDFTIILRISEFTLNLHFTMFIFEKLKFTQSVIEAICYCSEKEYGMVVFLLSGNKLNLSKTFC